MLNQRLVMLMTIVMVFANACAKNDEPKGVIPEAQLQAMKKARAVEDALQKQHEELRKKLEEE